MNAHTLPRSNVIDTSSCAPPPLRSLPFDPGTSWGLGVSQRKDMLKQSTGKKQFSPSSSPVVDRKFVSDIPVVGKLGQFKPLQSPPANMNIPLPRRVPPHEPQPPSEDNDEAPLTEDNLTMWNGAQVQPVRQSDSSPRSPPARLSLEHRLPEAAATAARTPITIAPTPQHEKSKVHVDLTAEARGELPKEHIEAVANILNTKRTIVSWDGSLRLEVTGKRLISDLVQSLRRRGIMVKQEGIRLVGSAASQIAGGLGKISVNDLDFTLYITAACIRFNDVLLAEEEVLANLLNELKPEVTYTGQQIHDTFFRDCFKISNSVLGEWSFITVGDDTFTIDLKTVFSLRRPYDFSVNSFEIVLDPFFSSCPNSDPVTNIYFETTYGSVSEALGHLEEHRICTRHPEELHRGLFRYCHVLAKGFTPLPTDKVLLERIFAQDFEREFKLDQLAFAFALSKYQMRRSADSSLYFSTIRELIDRCVSDNTCKERCLQIVDSVSQKQTKT